MPGLQLRNSKKQPPVARECRRLKVLPQETPVKKEKDDQKKKISYVRKKKVAKPESQISDMN